MEIIDLGPDEKISAPGFYRMSLDRHHSQPCDGVSVTSGVLRRMELQTPADVWAFHQLNPNPWPQEDKTALRLGRAMAAYVEGGDEELQRHFLVLPEGAPRRPTGAQIAAYDSGKPTPAGKTSVEFWRKIEQDERDQISATEHGNIVSMGSVLAKDPIASLCMAGEPEVTMAWFDERSQLWFLSRPDVVNFDGTMIDYKKMNTQGRPFNYRVVDRRITEHAYHMQMGFAAEVFSNLTGEWPSAVGIVAQWDKPPYHCIVRDFLEDDLRMGAYLNHRAARRFRECLDSGHWPGPGEDIGAYQMPEWLHEQTIKEMQMEGTAP